MGQAKVELVYVTKGLDQITKQMQALEDKAKNIVVGDEAKEKRQLERSKKAQKVYSQSIDMQIKADEAKHSGLDKTYKKTQDYLALLRKGNTVSENQLKYLEKVEAKEINKLKLLKQESEAHRKNKALIKSQTEQMERQAKINQASAVKKSQDVYNQGLKLQIRSHQAIKGELEDTYKETQRLQALNRKGVIITKNQFEKLKLIEVTEKTRVAQLREQVKIKNALAKKDGQSHNSLIKTYALMRVLNKSMDAFRNQINYLRELDQSVYNLGVVAKKSTSEIESMKFELLDMGSKFPFQAKTIAEAMDTIGRTGTKYIDVFESIDDVMRLATASGSDLASTSGIN